MNRFLPILLLIFLFSGFGVVVYHVLRVQADAGKGMPDYSVYSAEKNGLAGVAQFLRNIKLEPVAVTRPIQHTRHRGLLIVAEPEGAAEIPGMENDVSEADARALVHWVEMGNTLLLCGRHMNSIHRELRVEIATDVKADPEDTLHPVELSDVGRYTQGIKNLVVEGHDVVQAGDGVPLWWVDNDFGAVLLKRGQGRVLIVPDASLLTLRGLHRADNVRLLYNVATLQARDGKVYFDEYHHGLESGGGFWGYLRYYDEGWMLLQLLLVVLVAVWSVAIRLGPAVPRPREIQADAVDYASAMARIYQRAGVKNLMAKALVRDFMTWLSQHLRLRGTVLPAEILAAWRRHYQSESQGDVSIAPPPEETDQPRLTARLQKLLRGVGQLRKGDVSERQLMGWAQAFDQFRADVVHGR